MQDYCKWFPYCFKVWFFSFGWLLQNVLLVGSNACCLRHFWLYGTSAAKEQTSAQKFVQLCELFHTVQARFHKNVTLHTALQVLQWGRVLTVSNKCLEQINLLWNCKACTWCQRNKTNSHVEAPSHTKLLPWWSGLQPHNLIDSIGMQPMFAQEQKAPEETWHSIPPNLMPIKLGFKNANTSMRVVEKNSHKNNTLKVMRSIECGDLCLIMTVNHKKCQIIHHLHHLLHIHTVEHNR